MAAQLQIHTDALVVLGPKLRTILRSTRRCNMWEVMTLSAVLLLLVVAPHLLDLTRRMVAGRPRGLKLPMTVGGVVHRGPRQRMERAGAGRQVLKLPMAVDGLVHRGPRRRMEQAGAGRRVLKLPMVVRTQFRPARTAQMAATDDNARNDPTSFPFLSHDDPSAVHIACCAIATSSASPPIQILGCRLYNKVTDANPPPPSHIFLTNPIRTILRLQYSNRSVRSFRLFITQHHIKTPPHLFSWQSPNFFPLYGERIVISTCLEAVITASLWQGCIWTAFLCLGHSTASPGVRDELNIATDLSVA